MKRRSLISVVMTAYNRPEYFREALDSWGPVAGLSRVHFVIRLEPSDVLSQMLQIVEEFREKYTIGAEVIVNSEVYGVLRHPWVAFQEEFATGAEFVIRTEDDIVVGQDVLHFMCNVGWPYMNEHPDVATVLAHTMLDGPEDAFSTKVGFDPWLWGTTRRVWDEVIKDNWDFDYSTYNHRPGFESGWDWHLNTRIFPARGLKTLFPLASRARNIGVVGVHGTPQNFRSTSSFVQDRPLVQTMHYVEGASASFQGVEGR